MKQVSCFREVYSMTQDGCDPLLGVSFSPSGHLLALISRSAIHLYQVTWLVHIEVTRGLCPFYKFSSTTYITSRLCSEYLAVKMVDWGISLMECLEGGVKNLTGQTFVGEDQEYAEFQAFFPIVRIGSPPQSQVSVAPPPFGSKGRDTLACGGGGGGGTQFRRRDRHSGTLCIFTIIHTQWDICWVRSLEGGTMSGGRWDGHVVEDYLQMEATVTYCKWCRCTVFNGRVLETPWVDLFNTAA